MAELYNIQSRQPEEVPDSQVDQALAEGTHSYKAGTNVSLKAPDGGYATIPAENIKYALGQGYKVLTPTVAAIDNSVEDNKGALGALKVFGSQVVDQLGFGLPELIYEKTGDPLEVAKYEAIKKDHDFANLLGNVAGFGLGLSKFTPAGQIFKGAGALGEATSSQVAARLGATVGEEAVGPRTLTQTAKNIVANLAGGVTGGAVEGAALFAPKAAAEASLGDPDQAAETVAAGLGIGGLLGGGGSIAKGLLGLTKAGLEKAAGVVGEAPLTAQKAARIGAETLTGVKEDAIDKYIQNPERINAAASIEQTKDLIDSDVAGLQQKLDLAKEGMLSSQRQAEEGYKYGLADLGKKTAPESLRNEIMTDLEASKAKIGDLSSEVDGELSKSDQTFNVSSLKDEIGKAQEDLKIGVREGQGGTPVGKASQAAFSELEGLKSTLSSLPAEITAPEMRKLVRQISENANFDYAAGEYNSQLDRIYKDIRKTLNTELKAKVPSIEPYLNEMSSILDTTNPLVKYFGKEKVADSTLERILSPKAKVERGLLESFQNITGKNYFSKLDELKNARSLLEEARVKNVAEKVTPDLFSAAEAAKKNYESLNEQYGDLTRRLGPARTQSIVTRQGYKNASIEDRRVLEKLGDLTGRDYHQMIDDRHVLESFKKVSTNGSRKAVVFGSLGAAIGGPVGAAIGAATGAGLDIYSGRLLKKLIDHAPDTSGLLFVEQRLKDTAKKLDEIPSILDRLTSKTPATPRGIATDIAGQILENKKQRPAKEKHVNIDTLRKDMASMLTNPSLMSAVLARYSSPISSGGAPAVGGGLNMKMGQAFNYIFSNLPKPAAPTSPFSVQAVFRPSDSEVSAFNQKLQVVEDPWSVLTELKFGTLTKNHMDALKAVYPKIHGLIQQKVQRHIMDGNAKPMPYQNRLKLSLLMDAPMDSSMAPEAISFYQASHNSPDQTVDTNVKARVNLSEDSQTDIQRMES